MKEFAVFWGCTIPARFPFLEKSVRTVFEGMGLPYKDVEGFSCCPEKSLINNVEPAMYRIAAARNIAVADAAGLDVVSPCTGCISNLATVKSELNSDPHEKAEVNTHLKAAGREFKGGVNLSHLVPFMHDAVGANRIRNLLKKDFKGMKIAIHYGCHMMRPSHALKADDPHDPVKFDNIIKVLGAESIDYQTKLTCCGQGLDRVDQHKNALHMARLKLRDIKMMGADAMVLCCPSCYLQFDNNQFLMKREGEDYNIPILYLTDLIGLAMGHTPEELGLGSHRMDVAPFLEKWARLDEATSNTEHVSAGLNIEGTFG